MTEDNNYDTVELRINDEPVSRVSLDLDSGKDLFDMSQKEVVGQLPRQALIQILSESFTDQFMHDLMRDFLVEHNWLDYGANGDTVENEKLREYKREKLNELSEEYDIVDYELEYDSEAREYVKKDNS